MFQLLSRLLIGLSFWIYGQQLQALTCNPQSITENQYILKSAGDLLITQNGHWLFIIDEQAHTVNVASTQEQRIVAQIPLDDIEPFALAASPMGDKLYVSGFSGNIAVINIVGDTPEHWTTNTWTIPGSFDDLLVSADGTHIFVTDVAMHEIKVLSASEGQIQKTFTDSECKSPNALAFDDKQQHLYVSCETSNRIGVFDITNNSLLKAIRVASGPNAVLLHPHLPKLFVTSSNNGDGKVTIINTNTLEVAQELPLLQHIQTANLLEYPIDMVLFQNTVWVLDKNKAQLIPLDPSKEILHTSTCRLGEQPKHLAVLSTPEKNQLYISSFSTGVEYTDISVRFVRQTPQVLMAGFDPMLIHKSDRQVKVLAVVEQGIASVESVALKFGNTVFTNMQLAGSLNLPVADGRTINALIYEATIPLTLAGLPPECAVGCSVAELVGANTLSIFGNLPNQFTLRAKDALSAIHDYPFWKFGDYPLVEAADVGQAALLPTYAAAGVHRGQPQVIMAGFTPMFMDIENEELKILAIVRPGSVAVASVGLKTPDNTLFTKMNKVAELPNGDEIHEGIVLKDRAAKTLFPEGFELFNIWNDFFQVVVRDEASQEHRFPDLRIGDYPAVN